MLSRALIPLAALAVSVAPSVASAACPNRVVDPTKFTCHDLDPVTATVPVFADCGGGVVVDRDSQAYSTTDTVLISDVDDAHDDGREVFVRAVSDWELNTQQTSQDDVNRARYFARMVHLDTGVTPSVEFASESDGQLLDSSAITPLSLSGSFEFCEQIFDSDFVNGFVDYEGDVRHNVRVTCGEAGTGTNASLELSTTPQVCIED